VPALLDCLLPGYCGIVTRSVCLNERGEPAVIRPENADNQRLGTGKSTEQPTKADAVAPANVTDPTAVAALSKPEQPQVEGQTSHQPFVIGHVGVMGQSLQTLGSSSL
jgi:hypothetical protein